MNVVLHLLLLIAPEYAIVPADAPVLRAMAARIFGFENPTRTSLSRGSGECLWFGGQPSNCFNSHGFRRSGGRV